MELLQLTYFCDAARSENFSKTAEKYKVPTSNISQTVKRLEGELGVKLFKRSANSITLSDEGKIFYEGAKRALDALALAKARLGEEGAVEIHLLIQTCRRIVTSAIEKFRSAFPEVSISISHTPEDGGEYDFIITDTVASPEDYENVFLIKEKIMLAVRRDSPLAKKEGLTLRELSGERFIALDGSRLHGFTELLCRGMGFVPSVAIRTDDPYYVRRYVEMGLGVALVPSISWRGQFSSDALLLDVGDYYRDTGLYVRRDKILTDKERAFFEILKETFEGEGQ